MSPGHGRRHVNTVYWLLRSEGELPEGNGWLSAAEAAVVARLTVPKRERDWLLGRWTAKQALAGRPESRIGPDSFDRLEIRAAADGAPEAFVAGQPLPVCLSISHAGGRALCAVSDGPVGCDLETIESRSEFFVHDYFTRGEQALVAAAPVAEKPLVENLIWSAKESALKALRVGLEADTRSVEVSLLEERAIEGWTRLQVLQVAERRVFEGWWRRDEDQVMTVVAPPPLPAPLRLVVEGD